ncbi:MAG: beta-lactamase family protein [Candidatus Eremiobacteraeota bacterium]|nr:beta-lactamase family protein [Candidatus Eremiobacteraeota bacterium]
MAQPAIAQHAAGNQILSGLVGKYYLAGSALSGHLLGERMRHYRVPAVSIAVVDNYHVVWTHAAGPRDIASKAPASTTTLFQAASMSKPVAAAAILRLFEDKHVSLDVDVNTLLKSWRIPPSPESTSEHVTMRRLLSHSAGINVSGFAGYDRDAALPTLVQILNGVAPANSEAIRVTSIPGSKTEYSGGGTSIAQQVATDMRGQPFAQFMQQTLLAPLSMTQSTFDQPLPRSLWPRAAHGYYSDERPVHRGWHVYPTMAAAGLWTTPTDLAKFVIAIQNALRREATSPIDSTVAREMTTTASTPFGLGPEVEPGYFSHSGANEGFQGIFYGLMSGGKGVVVMTNSDNGLLLADEIVHAVAKTYNWPVLRPQPKKAVALNAAAMQAVAGKYTGEVSGERMTLDITYARNRGAGVLLFRDPVVPGIQQQLYADGPLQFFTLSGGTLVFSRGGNGKVTSVEALGMKFARIR